MHWKNHLDTVPLFTMAGISGVEDYKIEQLRSSGSVQSFRILFSLWYSWFECYSIIRETGPSSMPVQYFFSSFVLLIS